MLILTAASTLALVSPALAQHAGHQTPAAPAADPSCPPEHAAMGHCTPAAATPAAEVQPSTDPHAGHAMPTPPAAEAQPDPHAGHAMPPADQQPDPHAGHGAATSPDQTPADPHAGHAMPPAPQPDPHAGHDMSPAPDQTTPDPHAGHDMGTSPEQQPADPSCPPEHAAMGHCTPAAAAPAKEAQPSTDPHAGHVMPGQGTASAPPVAPPPPEAFQGPENAAETVYDPALFRRKRQEELIDEHGGYVTWMLLADQLEYRNQDGRDGYKWDVQGWYGGDYNKLWVKTEGEGAFGEAAEQAEVQALYSRALDPWFNFQAGVRHDFRPDPERTHFVVGIQGLAPYWFEVDGALFLSDKGDLTARFEAEYDQRITNKLILQPLIEADFAAQDVPELGVGSGLSSIEAGLRLRYEFVPEFAPYVGVEYARKIGDTADFARAHGEDAGGWALLVGLRSWF